MAFRVSTIGPCEATTYLLLHSLGFPRNGDGQLYAQWNVLSKYFYGLEVSRAKLITKFIGLICDLLQHIGVVALRIC